MRDADLDFAGVYCDECGIELLEEDVDGICSWCDAEQE